MIHFAYPNVELGKINRFIGCGRYAAFAAPPDGYALARPQAVTLTTVTMAATQCAPESVHATRSVFERKDQAQTYLGDSQDLAYFLALVSRSRSVKLELSGDIWCTGTLDLLHGTPILMAVKQGGFDEKLTAFLSDDNQDTLFFVPLPNIQEYHKQQLQQQVRVTPLAQLQPSSMRALAGSKTIITVSGNELPQMIGVLFESLQFNIEAFRMWQERIRTAFLQWKTSNYEDDLLLQGDVLTESQAWLSERRNELQPEELLFVENSVYHQQLTQQQRSGRFEQWRTRWQHLSKDRQQTIVMIAVILGLMAVGLGGYQTYRMTRPTEERLLNAVRQGDFNGMNTAIARQPDINAQDASGISALMYASSNGRVDMMETLLKYGGLDVNARDKQGRTALFYAAEYGKPTAVDWLLRANADVLVHDQQGQTALMSALKGKRPDVITMLIASGSEKNIRDKNGDTILTLCIKESQECVPSVFQALLENGLDPTFQDKNGKTALMYAATESANEFVALLLEHGDLGATVDDDLFLRWYSKGRYSNYLAEMFAQRNLLATSLYFASYLDSDRYMGNPYKTIIENLLNSGKHEQALLIARTIHTIWQANVFAWVGEFGQALEVARTIADAETKAWALSEIVAALVQAGKFDQALEVARTIEITDDVLVNAGDTFIDIVATLAQGGKFDQALEMARTIKPARIKKAKAIIIIVAALVQAGKVEQAAEEVARTIEDADYKAWGLALVGEYAQALDVARTIEDAVDKAIALKHIVEALAEAGKFDQAAEVARTIEDAVDKAIALKHIVEALAEAGKFDQAAFDQAAEVARTIEDARDKAIALRAIVEALAEAGKLDQAAEVARTIEDAEGSREKSYALKAIVEALAQTGKIDEAAEVARTIENAEMKDWALEALVKALVDAGKFDQALVELEQIVDRLRETEKIAFFLSISTHVFAAYPDPAQQREWASKIMTVFTQSKDGADDSD